jgi:hypothetical protein
MGKKIYPYLLNMPLILTVKLGFCQGLHIGKYPSPLGGYQLMSFGGKIWKGVREKEEKVKEAERKREMEEQG